jgi:hypothetical protein
VFPEYPLCRFRKQSVSRLHMLLFLRACYMAHPIQLQKCIHNFDSGSDTSHVYSGSVISDLYSGSDTSDLYSGRVRCHYPQALRGCPQSFKQMRYQYVK